MIVGAVAPHTHTLTLIADKYERSSSKYRGTGERQIGERERERGRKLVGNDKE